MKSLSLLDRTIVLMTICLIPTGLYPQSINVSVHIDPSLDTASISPMIYGTNGTSQDREANIRARRIGGNRLTGYNWENNASNMGMDYNQSNANDNYMPWVMGIPDNKGRTPGIVLATFHDSSLACGAYSLITLPAAGYVSRDEDGSVSVGQTAPSYRWREVRARKGSALSTTPDTSDGYVYVDEEVNFLVQQFGLASGTTGVRGYAVDNEPACWPSTHPRIHPDQPTAMEVVRKNVAVAKAVKSVDPSAEVFGGVSYGFNEQYNMQNAPDWNTFANKYGRYNSMFLGLLHDSSVAAGQRLVDVYDVHWYPDLYNGIVNENSDSATAAARMYAPRSLWDSSYVENGWIGQWYSPVSLLPNLKTAIARWNPGTKIAVTEFNYGGGTHVSGGIAIADVLGIFGDQGVYFASHWGELDGYRLSGYKIYQNYDGNGSTFGNLRVRSSISDVNNGSVHASLATGAHQTLHMVIMNKNFSHPLHASMVISGSTQYLSCEIYGFDASGTSIKKLPSIVTITGNAFTYDVPPLTVLHLVLESEPTGVPVQRGQIPLQMHLEQNFPNPFNPGTMIRYYLPHADRIKLKIYDVLGREVATLVDLTEPSGWHQALFNAGGYASGVYLCKLEAGGIIAVKRMVLAR